MARTRITVCGITEEEQAIIAAEAGADAVSFFFARGTPRTIDPDEAYGIMGVLPPLVASIGVFVDPTIDEFSDVEEICPTIYSQFAGAEDVQLARSCGPDVIKVIRFDESTISRDLALWDEVEEVCAIVVEAGAADGSFDWARLTPHLENIATPIILSGGLTPRNVGEAILAVRPYAVEACAGVEREPGVKDLALIEEFCLAVQGADRE
jgi:phosphoribosylanthranilate isomerase